MFFFYKKEVLKYIKASVHLQSYGWYDDLLHHLAGVLVVEFGSLVHPDDRVQRRSHPPQQVDAPLPEQRRVHLRAHVIVTGFRIYLKFSRDIIRKTSIFSVLNSIALPIPEVFYEDQAKSPSSAPL